VWTTLAYLPASFLVIISGGGLVMLWMALGVWMVARMITLGLRAYGTRWLVIGA
jgi:hypothetical protein